MRLPFHRLGDELPRVPGCNHRAFTLLEVMIASGIFFMATFAILALVSGTLRNARALQKPQVDAGLVAAEYMNTNRFSEGRTSGSFEDSLRDYSYETDTYIAGTNGLFQADMVLRRHGLDHPADAISIFVFDPMTPSTPFGGNRFR